MGMRAVIADDEVLIRMYIREILENNGYEIAGEAEDGMDAVTVCREQRPDFVIMDINMPVMTGLEAARVIREESLAGFVVVLTAYRDKEIAEQAVDLDVMGYVVKPVDEDTLIPAVRIAEKKYLQLEELVRTYTDLSESDIRLLLDVSHGLPFVGNLESGDTYINVLTRDGRSMVVAQYRHPDCDLYKRDIIGEMERREDEPAVYRALEHGTSGRGLIGIIDSGKTVVRHTVSPIFNEQRKVIGSLTYEYLNPDSDTEPIRLVSAEGEMPPFAKKMDKVISSLQDGFLIFDERGICTLSNGRTEELYREIGCTGGVTGKSYRELRLEGQPEWEEIAAGGTLRNEIQIGRYVFDETISAVQENGISQGIVIILRDKTRIRQLEDEIEYRAALVREVHHRVKNNLQTIISLVGLEAARKKNDEVKEFSRTITGQIRSMSVTYDLLAHTDTELVDVGQMLSRIIDGVLGGYASGDSRIEAEIRGDRLMFPELAASTVALIVNELVTNSMKYAFHGRDHGKIELTMESGEEIAWFTVEDDGCGMEKSGGERGRGGLGLNLVQSLVKSSLKGDLFIEEREGGGVKIRFSVRGDLYA